MVIMLHASDRFRKHSTTSISSLITSISAGISALFHGHHSSYQLREISPINYMSLLDNISLSDADVFLQNFDEILALYFFPMQPLYLLFMLSN